MMKPRHKAAPLSRATLELPRVPPALRELVLLLPQYPHSLALCAVLNLFGKDLFTPDDAARLHEKVIALHVADAGVQVLLRVSRGSYIACHRSTKPDVTIRADARDFLLLALGKVDGDMLFFDRRLSIVGDTDLGLIIKGALDRIPVPLPPAVLNLLRERLG